MSTRRCGGDRNPVYLVSLSVFAALELGAGWSSTIAARCILRSAFSCLLPEVGKAGGNELNVPPLRFFAGCFASSPLSNAAAGIGDLWTASERTVVFPIFAVFGLTGPCLGQSLDASFANNSASG